MRLESIQVYKKQLTRAIKDTIEYRGYTVHEAAKLANCAPANLSGLLSGRNADGFTLDRLVSIALGIGLRVNLSVERKYARRAIAE
jgi:transcriptional regulator with XRE-family HTH domain